MFKRRWNRVADFWRRKGPKSRLEKIIVYGSVFLFFAIPIALFVGTRAWTLEDVRITNETEQRLLIYMDGYHIGTLAPQESLKEDWEDWDHPRLIEAVDHEGRVVFDVELSRSELHEVNNKVRVIKEYQFGP